jgi:hypothetical protein
MVTTAKAVSPIDVKPRPDVVIPAILHILRIDWGLSNEEQMTLLGLSSRQTLANWRTTPASATLTRDLLERASYILGIHKSLQILFSDKKIGVGWLFVKNSNKAFGGVSPMERMLNGMVVDLAFVRQFLDYERGA